MKKATSPEEKVTAHSNNVVPALYNRWLFFTLQMTLRLGMEAAHEVEVRLGYEVLRNRVPLPKVSAVIAPMCEYSVWAPDYRNVRCYPVCDWPVWLGLRWSGP